MNRKGGNKLDSKQLYESLQEIRGLTVEAIKQQEEKTYSLFKMIHNQDSKIKELIDRIEELERKLSNGKINK